MGIFYHTNRVVSYDLFGYLSSIVPLSTVTRFDPQDRHWFVACERIMC